MRSLIIIAVVAITFIAVVLIMPMKKDMQPAAAVTTQSETAAADTSIAHAAQHAGGALTPKTDTVLRHSDDIRYAHKHRPSAARSISL